MHSTVYQESAKQIPRENVHDLAKLHLLLLYGLRPAKFQMLQMNSHGSSSALLRVVALVILVAAVTFISVMPQVSNDFWLQAKVGELIVQNHAIPTTVLFPFTTIQTAQFNAHEWLPSILFFALVRVFGEDGLPLVLGVAGLLLFATMSWLAYLRSGKNLPLSLMLGLMAVAVENYRHYLRPELVSLIFLGAYWLLLDANRRSPAVGNWLGALVIVVFWANTHGSFILAPLIGGVYATGTWIDSHRRMSEIPDSPITSYEAFALFTVVALVCTLINPFGWNLLKFVFDFSRSSVAHQYVLEWLPTFDQRMRHTRGLWIGVACGIFASSVLLRHARKVSAVDGLMFLLFLVLAVGAIRFLVYLGMVSAFALAALAPQGWRTPEAQRRLYVISIATGSAILGSAMVFGNALHAYPHKADFDSSFSAPLVKELADPSLKGNVLTDYDLGAELVYRAYPRLRPSIDSRIDSYGDAYFQFHEDLFKDDILLNRFVNEYNVRYMLVYHYQLRMLEQLPSWKDRRWVIRFMDQKVVLLQRDDSENINNE